MWRPAKVLERSPLFRSYYVPVSFLGDTFLLVCVGVRLNAGSDGACETVEFFTLWRLPEFAWKTVLAPGSSSLVTLFVLFGGLRKTCVSPCKNRAACRRALWEERGRKRSNAAPFSLSVGWWIIICSHELETSEGKIMTVGYDKCRRRERVVKDKSVLAFLQWPFLI